MTRTGIGMQRILLAGLLAFSAACAGADEPDDADERRQFTFAWPFTAADEMRPRGGTSRGPAVELSAAPTFVRRTLAAYVEE